MLYPTPAAGGKRKKHLTTSQMAARKAARAYRARLSKRIGTVNRRLALSSKKVTVRTSKSGKKRKVHTASYSINRAAKHSLNAARKYVGYKYPASVRESARKLGSIRLNPSLQGVMSDIKLIAPDFALAFGGTLAVLWASMKGKAWLNDQDFIKNATADSFAMKLKPYIPALVTVVTGTAAWAGMRYLAGGKLARFSNPVLMAAAAVAAVRVAQIPLFEKTDANGAVVNGADGKPEIISLDKKLELGISSYVRVSGYTVGGYTVGGTGIFAQRTLGAGPSRLMLPAAQRVAGSGGQRHMTRRNNLDLFDNAGVLSGSIFDS